MSRREVPAFGVPRDPQSVVGDAASMAAESNNYNFLNRSQSETHWDRELHRSHGALDTTA